MQVYGSPYRSCLDCARTIFVTEGPIAFYRSFWTQLVMNIPFQSLHFVIYEFCQDCLNPDRRYRPTSHMVSGAVAGAVASAATTPFDVCKTLLNTQEKGALGKGQHTVSGIVDAVKTIHRLRGLSGFFSGVAPRIVFVVPSTAIAWGVYEFFKYFITRHNYYQNDSPSDTASLVLPSSIISSE